jgi:NTP pyrophosphatase (non-canonical NTP hydrolase)
MEELAGSAESGQHRMTNLRATISGSFRRDLEQIGEAMKLFQSEGVEIISPRTHEAVGNIDDFVLVEGDMGTPAELERAHLDAIARSNLLYVVNPGGYLGLSVSMEIGFALAYRVSVFAQERFTSRPFDGIVEAVSPREAARRIATEHDDVPRAGLTLSELQRWLALTARQRGFGHEGARDLLLLLTEEVGELARVVRTKEGIAGSVRAHEAEPELADCLIYVALLADRLGLDLERALLEKEARNAERYPRLAENAVDHGTAH